MAYTKVMTIEPATRGMTQTTAELYDRVVTLFATRSVSFADRQTITAALEPAIRFNSGVDLAFADLPAEVQQLIETNEAKPQIDGWTSPKDVPAGTAKPAKPMPGSAYVTIEEAAPDEPRQAPPARPA